MLGGFSVVTHADVSASSTFLRSFLYNPSDPTSRTGRLCACDCGSGIGRVTKHLLLRFFTHVDLVDSNLRFLLFAQKALLSEHVASGQVERFIHTGLQDFSPEHDRYDVIWCQWVLSHLTDDDLVSFLKRCKCALRPNGLICVKENVSREDYLVDSKDSSVIRSDELWRRLFAKANMRVVKEAEQFGFPDELLTVKMYALN